MSSDGDNPVRVISCRAALSLTGRAQVVAILSRRSARLRAGPAPQRHRDSRAAASRGRASRASGRSLSGSRSRRPHLLVNKSDAKTPLTVDATAEDAVRVSLINSSHAPDFLLDGGAADVQDGLSPLASQTLSG